MRWMRGGVRTAVLACLVALPAGCADIADGTGIGVPLEIEGDWRATAYTFQARGGGEQVDLVAQTGLSLRMAITGDGELAGTIRVNDPDAGLVDRAFTGLRSPATGGGVTVTVAPPITLAGETLLAGGAAETYASNTLTWRYEDASWDFDLQGPRRAEPARATLVLTRVF